MPAYLKLSLTPVGSMEMKVLWNKSVNQYLGFYTVLLMPIAKFPLTLTMSIFFYFVCDHAKHCQSQHCHTMSSSLSEATQLRMFSTSGVRLLIYCLYAIFLMNIQDDTHSSTTQALSYFNLSSSINNLKMVKKKI